MNNQEAIKLLKTALCPNVMNGCQDGKMPNPIGEIERQCEWCDKRAKTLAFLREQPKCKTCGGSGKRPDFDAPAPKDKPFAFKQIPCPDCQQPKCKTCGKAYKAVDHGYDLKADRQYVYEPICECQQQPEAGEFTKEFGKIIKLLEDFHNSLPRTYKSWGEEASITFQAVQGGRQACDIIERQANRIKELEQQPGAGDLVAQAEEFIRTCTEWFESLSIPEQADLYGYKGERAIKTALGHIQSLLSNYRNIESFRKSYLELNKRNIKACETIGRQAAELKGHKTHIKLLQACDDTSTKTIYKMDKELKEKEATNKRLEYKIDRLNSTEFVSFCRNTLNNNKRLKEYAQHLPGCNKKDGGDYDCNCGFEQVVKGEPSD